MAKFKNPTKVKPKSVIVLLLGIAVILLINILSRFGVWDFTSNSANLITIVGALFLISETSIYAVMRKIRGGVNRSEGLDILIGVVGILALLGVGFNMFGLPLNVLNPVQGIVDAGLLIFVLLEIFRKNK